MASTTTTRDSRNHSIRTRHVDFEDCDQAGACMRLFERTLLAEEERATGNSIVACGAFSQLKAHLNL